LQLGLKLLNPALLGVLDGLGFTVALEGSVAVLEELLCPASVESGRSRCLG
jgi:hypothetical protein